MRFNSPRDFLASLLFDFHGRWIGLRGRLRPISPQGLVLAAVLAALAVSAGLSARHLRSGGGRMFPRHESEFLPSAELDRRLDSAQEKLKAEPDHVQTLIEFGILLFQKGTEQYLDAINALEAARKLGALDSRIFYYLGVMYQEEGLYPFATEEYQRYLRNQPGDAEVRQLLAKLLYQSGQYEAAQAQYRVLLNDHPKDPLALENLALCLKALNRRGEAAAILQELSTRDTACGHRAHFHLGEMAFEDKDYKQALRHYLAILPVEENEDFGIPLERFYASVAANYEKIKLFRDAKACLEKVLILVPKDSQQYTQAKTSLKSVEAALKKLAQAAARSKKKKK